MTLKIAAPLAWFGPGELVKDAAVVVRGGRVRFAGRDADAPTSDDAIEVEGFLMPGVVDRHVHVRLSDPAAVLLGGVTAVRDLAWDPDEIFPLADASELPTFTGPLIRAAGPMLTAPGGYPVGAGWAPEGGIRELRGLEDAIAAVGELADRGAAAIKVALNAEVGPTPSDRELAGLVESAHERGLPVTVHVQGPGQTERAVGAGVDELAHTPWTERLSDLLLESAARTLRIVSTLDIHSYGEITPELRVACDNLVRFRAAGGTVVYGTDLGNGPIPAGIHVREALLLHEAVRMTPEEVLTAMTPGRLAKDSPADLIVVGANPLERVEALGELRLVVRSGRVVAGSRGGAS
jgi:imidazolonepropionase-like amidohydrolase